MKKIALAAVVAATLSATSAYAASGTVTHVWAGLNCTKFDAGGFTFAIPNGTNFDSLRATLQMIYNDGQTHNFFGTNGEANACTNVNGTVYTLTGIDD